ncbi:MAG: LysR family transcriptional regulator [Acetobacteraceae bacterium]|nr:LysR family transcriptional regulator [Acetobacteraceae bacterium]
MNVADLRVFGVVARLGGMGRAASHLNTVQSNVSAHIRRLEADLGEVLFQREPRGVALTEGGKRLVPFAQALERLLADAARAVADDGRPRGRLLLGTLETTAALRLPDAVAAFVAAYPEVDLTLRTGTTCELIERVVTGDVEGAFVCGPVRHPDLIAETVLEEELALLSAPGIRSLAEVIGQKDLRIVVLRAGCSYRQILEQWLVRQGVGQPRVMEFGTLEAVVSCVGAGLGVTMLPRGLLGPVWPSGRVAVHPLPSRDARVETQVIRRRDAYVSAALAAFLELLRARQRAVRTAA